MVIISQHTHTRSFVAKKNNMKSKKIWKPNERFYISAWVKQFEKCRKNYNDKRMHRLCDSMKRRTTWVHTSHETKWFWCVTDWLKWISVVHASYELTYCCIFDGLRYDFDGCIYLRLWCMGIHRRPYHWHQHHTGDEIDRVFLIWLSRVRWRPEAVGTPETSAHSRSRHQSNHYQATHQQRSAGRINSHW